MYVNSKKPVHVTPYIIKWSTAYWRCTIATITPRKCNRVCFAGAIKWWSEQRKSKESFCTASHIV